MKGEPISSGYLSDHETKLQDMVQQLSVESQDSRFCYLTSSEVSKILIYLIETDAINVKHAQKLLRLKNYNFVIVNFRLR